MLTFLNYYCNKIEKNKEKCNPILAFIRCLKALYTMHLIILKGSVYLYTNLHINIFGIFIETKIKTNIHLKWCTFMIHLNKYIFYTPRD